MSSGIDGIVRESAAEQVTLHRITGGVWAAIGAMFSVALFVPGKPSEEALRLPIGAGGLLVLVLGIAYVVVMTGRTKTLVELLLTRRSELKDASLVGLKTRGTVITHVIAVRDGANRKYTMRVRAEANARAMLAGIPT